MQRGLLFFLIACLFQLCFSTESISISSSNLVTLDVRKPARDTEPAQWADVKKNICQVTPVLPMGLRMECAGDESSKTCGVTCRRSLMLTGPSQVTCTPELGWSALPSCVATNTFEMHGCGAGTNKLYFDLGLPTNILDTVENVTSHLPANITTHNIRHVVVIHSSVNILTDDAIYVSGCANTMDDCNTFGVLTPPSYLAVANSITEIAKAFFGFMALTASGDVYAIGTNSHYTFHTAGPDAFTKLEIGGAAAGIAMAGHTSMIFLANGQTLYSGYYPTIPFYPEARTVVYSEVTAGGQIRPQVAGGMAYHMLFKTSVGWLCRGLSSAGQCFADTTNTFENFASPLFLNGHRSPEITDIFASVARSVALSADGRVFESSSSYPFYVERTAMLSSLGCQKITGGGGAHDAIALWGMCTHNKAILIGSNQFQCKTSPSTDVWYTSPEFPTKPTNIQMTSHSIISVSDVFAA